MLSCSVLSNSLQPHGTVACQVPLSMEFSRQEYRGGLPGELTDPRMEHPCILFLLHWQAYSLRLSHQGSPGGWNQGLKPNLAFRTAVLCLLALLDLGNAVEIESANAKTFLYLEKNRFTLNLEVQMNVLQESAHLVISSCPATQSFYMTASQMTALDCSPSRSAH